MFKKYSDFAGEVSHNFGRVTGFKGIVLMFIFNL